MRTIANLNGVEFLRAINRARYAVEKLLTVTDVAKIRKNVPKLTGKETPEEKKEKERAQAKKNLSDMLDSLLEKHPEETYECIMALCIVEDGEEPDGFEIMSAAFSLISDKRVLDFFMQLVKLGRLGTDS